MIENRHSGIPTMKREMKKYGLPDPEFCDERDSFKVIFRNSSVASGAQRATQSVINIEIDEIKQKVLNYCQIAKSSKEIKEYIGFSSKTYVAENIIKPLIKLGMLKYTNNKSINARNQKYITVKK